MVATSTVWSALCEILYLKQMARPYAASAVGAFVQVVPHAQWVGGQAGVRKTSNDVMFRSSAMGWLGNCSRSCAVALVISLAVHVRHNYPARRNALKFRRRGPTILTYVHTPTGRGSHQ